MSIQTLWDLDHGDSTRKVLGFQKLMDNLLKKSHLYEIVHTFVNQMLVSIKKHLSGVGNVTNDSVYMLGQQFPLVYPKLETERAECNWLSCCHLNWNPLKSLYSCTFSSSFRAARLFLTFHWCRCITKLHDVDCQGKSCQLNVQAKLKCEMTLQLNHSHHMGCHVWFTDWDGTCNVLACSSIIAL